MEQLHVPYFGMNIKQLNTISFKLLCTSHMGPLATKYSKEVRTVKQYKMYFLFLQYYPPPPVHCKSYTKYDKY